jgi:hypothetical protein
VLKEAKIAAEREAADTRAAIAAVEQQRRDETSAAAAAKLAAAQAARTTSAAAAAAAGEAAAKEAAEASAAAAVAASSSASSSSASSAVPSPRQSNNPENGTTSAAAIPIPRGANPQSPVNVVEPNGSAESSRKGQAGQPCRRWAKKGTCSYGDQCRFSHAGAPDVPASEPEQAAMARIRLAEEKATKADKSALAAREDA